MRETSEKATFLLVILASLSLVALILWFYPLSLYHHDSARIALSLRDYLGGASLEGQVKGRWGSVLAALPFLILSGEDSALVAERAVILSSVLGAVLLILSSSLLLRSLDFKRMERVWVAWLLASSPILLTATQLGKEHALESACIIISALFVLSSDQKKSLFLSAVFAVIAVSVRESAVLLLPSLAVLTLLPGEQEGSGSRLGRLFLWCTLTSLGLLLLYFLYLEEPVIDILFGSSQFTHVSPSGFNWETFQLLAGDLLLLLTPLALPLIVLGALSKSSSRNKLALIVLLAPLILLLFLNVYRERILCVFLPAAYGLVLLGTQKIPGKHLRDMILTLIVITQFYLAVPVLYSRASDEALSHRSFANKVSELVPNGALLLTCDQGPFISLYTDLTPQGSCLRTNEDYAQFKQQTVHALSSNQRVFILSSIFAYDFKGTLRAKAEAEFKLELVETLSYDSWHSAGAHTKQIEDSLMRIERIS